MAPRRVVEGFNIVEDYKLGVAAGGWDDVVQFSIAFAGAPEGLDEGVVITVAGSTHACYERGGGQGGCILMGSILAAAIGVMQQAQARPCDRLLEETLTPCAGLNPYQVARSTTRTVGVEALVRFEKSDYSVPARWLGTRVTIDAGDSFIVIRAKDLVIAEHPVATAAGQRIEAPAHVRERWARSVPAPTAAPPKGCHITFTEAVQVRPLAVYAEVAL